MLPSAFTMCGNACPRFQSAMPVGNTQIQEIAAVFLGRPRCLFT
jgi:hypothetical protein